MEERISPKPQTICSQEADMDFAIGEGATPQGCCVERI